VIKKRRMLKKPASEMKEGSDSKSDLVRDVFEPVFVKFM
jgi:hypothetical protein